MYTPILAALAFILSSDGKNTLLIHRNKRKEDLHYGKYNGLGGKMEAGEDVISCIKREILEEAGVEATTIQLRGTISWPGFGGEGEDWFGFVFLVTEIKGDVFRTNDEGDLVWKAIKDMKSLPMWEGDRYFLPLVFDNDPRVFHGCMPYMDGRPLSWDFKRI